MIERGSFVTEYIYCDKCLEAAKKILIAGDKYLHGVEVSSWDKTSSQNLPIIAGKIGGRGSGDELITFEYEILPELSKVICHNMRVAVLGESGERIFNITPESETK